jgi:tetratricopeptide (TPR) repeat protein
METCIAFRRHYGMWAGSWMVALVCWMGFGAAAVRSQMSQAGIERIEMLRGEIKNAESRHAGAAEVGVLWLQLANRYQNELEFTDAEDAFARALRLLRTGGPEALYANALDGMGSLYMSTGRLSEAGDYLHKALLAYEGIGDRAHVAVLHESTALQELLGRRYRKAEEESAEALTEMKSLGVPNASEMAAAYLTHSYAVCYEGRCGAALEDVDRAKELIEARLQPNSVDMAAMWETRGFAEVKLGRVDAGDEDMREAVRVLRSRTDLPRGVVVDLELGVMRQQDVLMKAAHRKAEEKQIEAEIGQLESERPVGCSGCTVSAAALGLLH